MPSRRKTRALRTWTPRRDGIESARMKRRALHKPNGGENRSSHDSVRANRISGVVRAGRGEAAAAGGAKKHRQHGRERALVNPNEGEQREARQLAEESNRSPSNGSAHASKRAIG